MPSTAAEPRGRPALRPPVFRADPAELANLAGLAGEKLTLRGPEGRHASTVRRLGTGERADLTDGAGTVAECVVIAGRPGELELELVGWRIEPRPDPQVTVLQAIPKGDRGELAVELLTEIGADVIVPWAAQRCVAVWRGDRAAKSRARWASAAEQAAKQSRRAWFPEIAPQADLSVAASLVEQAALAIVLDPDAAKSVAGMPLPSRGQIVLIVGPEGGIAPAEADALRAAGAVPATLGPTVLRASTAGAVAAGLVLSRTPRWSR